MKILFFIISTLTAGLVFSEETKISRTEHVKAFNKAQRCYNSTPDRQPVKKGKCAYSALKEGRFLFEPDSLNIAALTYNYGMALKRRDKDKAHDVLGQSLELYEAIYGESSLEIIHILIDMGESRKVKAIAKKNFDQNSVEYAGILLELSLSEMITLGETSRYARSALEIYLEKEGVESHNTATASYQMGKVKFAQKKYESAIPYLIGATKHPEVATYAHGWLVRAYGLTDQDDMASYHATQIGQSQKGEKADLVPLFVPSPDYPRFAASRGMSGYAVIKLTISKEGRATDVVLIEESPESWGFGEEALKAGATLVYAPRFVDGVAQEVPGVLYKYSFKMAN
jgi:TonB family protein